MTASRAAGSYPDPPEPLPHPIVDSHTHLDMGTGAAAAPDDDHDYPPLDWFLSRADRAGVPRAVQIGCELPSARWTADVVARTPELLGGVALHPNEAPELARSGGLDDALGEIDRLLAGERIRVVGETGLDYFRTGDDGREAQHYSFREHIALAKRHGLALQIHDRDAHDDVLRILAEEGAPDIVVFHCFSGDAEMADYCAAHGWYMSFAGNVTFKNAGGLRAAAARVPAGQLLLETDAPFLTPVPHRGRPGGSYLTPLTARVVADVRDEPLEELCAAVWANSLDVFGKW